MAESSGRVSVVSPPVPVFLSAAEKQQEQAWSQLVVNHYAERLREHTKAREYLRTQGLQDFALLSQLKVGFCDRTLHHLLPADGRGGEQIRGALQRVGLLKPSGHELMRGALVFPFHNAQGQLVGAYGRRITPRLVARCDYYVHWDLYGAELFPQPLLGNSGRLILVKNALEVLLLHQEGLFCARAPLGLKSLNASLAQNIANQGVKRVLLALGESALAIKATERFSHCLERVGLCVQRRDLPKCMDVQGYVKSGASRAELIRRLGGVSHG